MVPLAGILSCIAARLYDMGATSRSQSEHEEDTEQTPLLPDSERAQRSSAPAKKAARWMMRNVATVLTSLLILAVILVLCIFFGGESLEQLRSLSSVAGRLTATVHRAGKTVKAKVCLTPACVHASSEILYNLSPEYKNIDPCTHFEEQVCGGWTDKHDLRPDQGDAFTGTIMSENSQMLLRHILEAPYPNDSKVSSQITSDEQS